MHTQQKTYTHANNAETQMTALYPLFLLQHNSNSKEKTQATKQHMIGPIAGINPTHTNTGIIDQAHS